VTVTAALAAAILAAAVLALLWPEEWGTSAGRTRAVIFTLLVALVGVALAGRQAERSESATTARAFEAYIQGLMSAKAAEAPGWFAGLANGPEPAFRRAPLEQAAVLRQRALRSYAEAVRLAPEARLFRRQYAILLADAGRRAEALQQFRQLRGHTILRGRGDHGYPRSGWMVRGRSPGGAAEKANGSGGKRAAAPDSEAELWERLYGDPPPRPAELPRLAAHLRPLHLGWFEHLVWRSVYRRMGLAQQAEAASRAASREALLLILTLSTLMLGLIGAAFLGLGLWVAAIISWRAGRLRPVPAVLRAGAAPLLEAFILYMFLSVAPVLLRMVGGAALWRGLERSLIATVGLWLGQDVLALAAVAYLWVRLRALGLSLAEIGLHTREWRQNLLYGVGGYVAALPLVIGSAFLVSWLGRRFFPQVPPPFHPFLAVSAAAGSGWIRFALLLAAAVLAPILEEFFFRGLLYGALRRRFGISAGIVTSAAVFSLLHPQLPLGFLSIFVLGAVFAGLYEWRQSLVPGMVMHALNNGIIWVYLNLLFSPG
jgi:membrane protease YdiL (CAAX protease family)